MPWEAEIFARQAVLSSKLVAVETYALMTAAFAIKLH